MYIALIVKDCPQGVTWELCRNADSGSVPQTSGMRTTGCVLLSVQQGEKLVLACLVTRRIKFILPAKCVIVVLKWEHVSESLQGCYTGLLNPTPVSNSVGRRRALGICFSGMSPDEDAVER